MRALFRREEREEGPGTGWREASRRPDTCCHGWVAVSCACGHVSRENTMGLPWQEEASCFAARAHCWTLRGGAVCVCVFEVAKVPEEREGDRCGGV